MVSELRTDCGHFPHRLRRAPPVIAAEYRALGPALGKAAAVRLR